MIDRREDLQVATSSRIDPSPGSHPEFCLRCDGAFKQSAAAIGVLLQGSNELILDGAAKKVPVVSSLFSEASAV